MSLCAQNLGVGYHPGRPVVEGVDLEIAAGTIIGLTGPSGSGKTTVARTMAGLLVPDAGEVTLDGAASIGGGAVAMMFQSPRLATSPRWTLQRIIGEPLSLAGAPRSTRDDRVRDAAARVGLTPDLLTRHPHQVSDGQLQRAGLARALLQRPRYLICDEMTAMLDPATTAALTAVITEEARAGLGVLVISHDLALLRVWTERVVDLSAATTQGRNAAATSR